MNTILLTDSYKMSHWQQYEPGTTEVFSYFESRGGRFPEVMFFGLQYILERYLTEKVTMAHVDEAAGLCAQHFGSDKLFNRKGWERIVYVHGGRLPVRIRAVPEGTLVGVSNVLMTAENTDPQLPWLTNYLETLLAQVWYPSTVATLSHATRKLILSYLNKTGDPTLIDFKLHDFGFRGASSVETAGLGGTAHLVNFKGTDTVPALTFIRCYYAKSHWADNTDPIAGFSVPASEHSTITSWGREREVDAYRNMIEQYGDQPFYSVVSDSFDLYAAARDLWGGQLHNEVLEAQGTLVVRPDSGHPAVVVPNLLTILGDKFGVETNSKGFKVLNPKVRVIQGDGMDYGLIDQTLATMASQGWSADNVTFGMGGGLLQKINRDTQKFAFKCSHVVVNGEQRDVFKDPSTDAGKVSKKGRLKLVEIGDRYGTVPESDPRDDLLVTVFEDGELTARTNLEEVRANAGTT
jgi:nicotinamide phosphoribosyltransferase